ncbi:MAG: T9SS type A sorting domain-containing protein, partial [Bacteroidota bacterium]
PEEVAFFDTYPDPNYGYRGVWSVYPFFPSGRIVASDRDYGLFVFELDASVVTTEPPVEPGEIALTAGPNPASGVMQVRVDLGTPSPVRLTVTDALGREVAVLHDGEATGTLQTTLDTGALAPGVYVLRLDASGETASQTITVVR